MTFDDTNQQPQGEPFTWNAQRPKINLTELAAAALDTVSGDRDMAVEPFLRSLRTKSLAEYEYRVSVAMRAWAMDVLRSADVRKRESIACDSDSAKGRMTKPNQPLSLSSLKSVAYAWFDWPVLPGVALRDATRADLNAAAQSYFKNSDTMTRRANWLSAIAEKMEDDTTKVAAIFKEKDVAALAAKHKVTTN